MEALAVTARLCGPQLELYGRCVAASPGSWQRDCHQLSLSVTECASRHPLVRRVRRECSDALGAFERCLRERPQRAAECQPHASRFLLCAHRVTQGSPGAAAAPAGDGATDAVARQRSTPRRDVTSGRSPTAAGPYREGSGGTGSAQEGPGGS